MKKSDQRENDHAARGYAGLVQLRGRHRPVRVQTIGAVTTFELRNAHGTKK
jgi:hypothetical protein